MKDVIFEKKTEPFITSCSRVLFPVVHFHKDVELIYVIEGSSNACADRKKYSLKKGDLFISFPNQIHYYENCEIGKYLLIIVSPDVLFDLKETLYNNIPKNNVLTIPQESETVKLISNAIFAQGEYSKTLQAGLLNQALAAILPQVNLTPRIKTNHTTLQEILTYCSTNFSNNITLDDVAEALHISKFHASHLLNDKLGLTFNTYLNGIRIDNACDYLKSTDSKIADISEEVGFGSIRSFNRAFQNVMGVSPTQYRDQFRK